MSPGSDHPRLSPAVPIPGDLLVAAAGATGDYFDSTVIFVIDVDDGALGVVVNRPSSLPVQRALPSWERVVAAPPALFEGGPVTQDAALCLGWRYPGESPPGWRRVAGDIGLVSLDLAVDDVQHRFRALRVFRGYAGWAAGQLDMEREAGLWHVVASRPDDVFSAQPSGLWRSVLRRAGGDLALIATWTPHADRN